MKLSIVTTLYNSASFINEFYQRASITAKKICDEYEIVMVNDGSPDNSLELAIELHKNDPRVRVIDLSRNFGHHKAMMTGFAQSRGDLVLAIDSDLEEEPELLENLYKEMLNENADVVYCVKEKRKGRWFERYSGHLYYWLLRTLSNTDIPSNDTMLRLMSRRYVDALIQHRDHEIFLSGLFTITGFKQIPYSIDKKHKGASTYTLRKKIKLAVRAFTTMSSTPLVFVFYLGSLITLLALVAAALLIVHWFVSDSLAGWSSLIISIWLLSGIIIFCLGIIGIYLSNIFMEIKRRPYTIIREIYQDEGLNRNKQGKINPVLEQLE